MCAALNIYGWTRFLVVAVSVGEVSLLVKAGAGSGNDVTEPLGNGKRDGKLVAGASPWRWVTCSAPARDGCGFYALRASSCRDGGSLSFMADSGVSFTTVSPLSPRLPRTFAGINRNVIKPISEANAAPSLCTRQEINLSRNDSMKWLT